MPDDEVITNTTPFTAPYPSTSGLVTPNDRECLALWVGESTGRELARLAATGQTTATVVLTAEITVGAATETLRGQLKGLGPIGQILAFADTSRCLTIHQPTHCRSASYAGRVAYGKPWNQARSQARVASRYSAAFLCNAKLCPEPCST